MTCLWENYLSLSCALSDPPMWPVQLLLIGH
ncbi:hypothetical protein KIPB_015811, partial [Kipferlia bialata]|eukprot:g15811.t1